MILQLANSPSFTKLNQSKTKLTSSKADSRLKRKILVKAANQYQPRNKNTLRHLIFFYLGENREEWLLLPTVCGRCSSGTWSIVLKFRKTVFCSHLKALIWNLLTSGAKPTLLPWFLWLKNKSPLFKQPYQHFFPVFIHLESKQLHTAFNNVVFTIRPWCAAPGTWPNAILWVCH